MLFEMLAYKYIESCAVLLPLLPHKPNSRDLTT
jgi:hypothetical protein